jgi:hypothetical protein
MTRIKVKVKATGQTGTVDEKEFNPNVYEILGVVSENGGQNITPTAQPQPQPQPVQTPNVQTPSQTPTSTPTPKVPPIPENTTQTPPVVQNNQPQPQLAQTPIIGEQPQNQTNPAPPPAQIEPVNIEALNKSLQEKVNASQIPQNPPQPQESTPKQEAPKINNESGITHNFVIPAPTPQVPPTEPIKVVEPPSNSPPASTLPSLNPHLIMPPLTHIPNVLNGIVQSQEGNLLEETIVLVKDKNNIPVRALKTNRLGQFVISTPVSNGSYRIEAEKDGYLFDIIDVEAKGVIVPPITIKARQ